MFPAAKSSGYPCAGPCEKSGILIFDTAFGSGFQDGRRSEKGPEAENGGQHGHVVSQRVSTIMNAEQIVVLDEAGSSAAARTGTFEKLPEYYESPHPAVAEELA